ncbi:AraC family transcriptional regulator [Paenibacillus protaetiae]|uniref:AraC family transcriptional regulator n=1 Tax=Paenibacillus protaetiae TaxID=2509456 RepID=A0A4P6EUH7_9BACL|nr:AraC family transcriptional regulator [Paenibacillus protaetiae]QAY66900.1 AraC family transcriptional regulator [Paenibacillus protaetiae]
MSVTETYTVASNPVIDRTGPVNVLFAGESQTVPGHRRGPKVYDFFLMHHVLSGKGTFICEGKRYELHAGHTFLIKPEQLVSYEADGVNPWRYRWVAFHGGFAPQLVEEAGFTGSTHTADTGHSRRTAVLYGSIIRTFREGGPSAHLQAAGYMHLLCALYASARGNAAAETIRTAEGESEKLFRQMVHYMSTQYAQPVSIEQMAESLGYSRAYLSRLFKQRTGDSPVTFLLKLRIDKGRHMLRERPELTIEQVAASVGLQDALYFSKQFRRFYHQSPTAYRKEMLSL